MMVTRNLQNDTKIEKRPGMLTGTQYEQVEPMIYNKINH